jgi:hypothetical protein
LFFEVEVEMETRIVLRLGVALALVVLVIWYNVKYQVDIVHNIAVEKKSLFPGGNSKIFSHSLVGSSEEDVPFAVSESAPLYSEEENKLSESGITWGEFVDLKPSARSRSLSRSVPYEYINTLIKCPLQASTKLEKSKLSDREKDWCMWAVNQGDTGGKVKVGESYGVLSPEERTKFDYLRCDKIASGYNPTCDEVRILCWKHYVLGSRADVRLVLGCICDRVGARGSFVIGSATL